MAELQAAVRLSQAAGAPLQAAVRATWGAGAPLQSTGLVVYVRPDPGTGTPVTPGSLAPRVDVPERLVHAHTHSILVYDLRAYEAALAALAPDAPAPQPQPLPVRAGTLSLGQDSSLWELRAEGAAELAELLLAQEQPPLVGVRINGEDWHFVIEGIDQPQAFASRSVSISGRSLAALADTPYQAPQTWITDAPTSAAQLAALANTFTGLQVDWLAPDWLIPAGAWSYQGSPLSVVGQVAAAIGAMVEPARAGLGLTVQRRYPVLPNEWATTAPDWQVHYSALERTNSQRADTPEYNAVLVTGQQQGGTLVARYAGTSGAVQAPLVSDPLLTDGPALLERATVLLASAGKQDAVTRTLQAGAEGVVPRGSLVRWVDPAETWTGLVRSVQVDFGFGRVRQTLGLERRTAFQEGVFSPPPERFEVLLLWLFSGPVGSSSIVDSSIYARQGVAGNAATGTLATMSSAWSVTDGVSLRCVGRSDAASVAEGSRASLLIAADEDFTFECYVKLPGPYNLPPFQQEMRIDATNGTALRRLRLSPSGGMDLFAGDNSVPPLGLPPGALQGEGHVAICRRRNVLKVYAAGYPSIGITDNRPWDFGALSVGVAAEVGERFVDCARLVRGALYDEAFVPPASLATPPARPSAAASATPPWPLIITPPLGDSVVEGQSKTFVVAATGPAPLTYQWRRNGVNIAGATSDSYTIAAVPAADNGARFGVVVSNAAGSTASADVSLAVVLLPVISTQPASVTVTEPAAATFSVAASTQSGTGPLTYQWRRNGVNIAGATSASYTLNPTNAAADNGAVFSVVVTSTIGSRTSGNATLTVNAAPSANFSEIDYVDTWPGPEPTSISPQIRFRVITGTEAGAIAAINQISSFRVDQPDFVMSNSAAFVVGGNLTITSSQLFDVGIWEVICSANHITYPAGTAISSQFSSGSATFFLASGGSFVGTSFILYL